MACLAGEAAQGWIGITTGPGGEELILAGEVTPLMEIEMGYKPWRQASRHGCSSIYGFLLYGDRGISPGRRPANRNNQWDRTAGWSTGRDEHVDLNFPGIHQAVKNHIGGR